SGLTWLFDIDSLTKTMNYQPVTAGSQSNLSAGEEIDQQYVLFHVWSSGSTNPQHTDGDAAFDGKEPKFDEKKLESEVNVSPSSKFEDYSNNRINEDNAAGTLVPTVGQISYNSNNTFSAAGPSNVAASPTHRKSSFIDASQLPDDPDMLELEDITYSDDEDDVGAEADFNNLETSIIVSPILTIRVYKVHPVTQIIGDLSSATQTRSMTSVFKNKKDERGIVIKNKARLVTQGHTQEEGINYEEVFDLVARIKAIRLFLAYASFMGFMVYQMDVKSAFLYGIIKEEVYVCQPLRFKDPDHPDNVYKVFKALYGLHQAPRAWYETLANYLLEKGFQRGKIDQTLFIKRQKGDILLVQIYVDDIIFGATNKDLCKSFKKLMKDKFQMSLMKELTFFLERKSASTPIDTEKPLLKDPNGKDVDVHTYRSMIGSLMYLTSSRPEIMFVVCTSEILRKFGLIERKSASTPIDTEKPLLKDPNVKRIFRYLKGKLHLGLLYPKDSSFDLVAYSDSDYAGASLDRKSTTGGFQFLGCRLISWQCKKQTVMATSSTEAEYVPTKSYSNHDLELVVSFVEKTIQDAEKIVQLVDRQHLFQTLDVRALPSQIVRYTLVSIDKQKDYDDTKILILYYSKSKDLKHYSTIDFDTASQGKYLSRFRLTAALARVTAAPSRRRKGVVIRDLQEESTTSTIIPHEATKSKDKGKGILVEEPKPLKKKQQYEQDEKYAREFQAKLNKNIDWDEVIDHVKIKANEDPAMDYFKGMSYDDIRPIFEAKFNSNVAFLLKRKEHIEEEESRALKRLNETLAERAAKRKKLDKEVEELKRHF
nr:hypothetical protein [Tanacetum cinerariifolium]